MLQLRVPVEHHVGRWRHGDRSGRRWLVISLELLPVIECRYPGFDTPRMAVYDPISRRIRDLPTFEISLDLLVARLGLVCATYGPAAAGATGLTGPRCPGHTTAGRECFPTCTINAPPHAARWFGLHWKTVKQIDRHDLERTRGRVDLTVVTVIAMDAFAVQKG